MTSVVWMKNVTLSFAEGEALHKRDGKAKQLNLERRPMAVCIRRQMLPSSCHRSRIDRRDGQPRPHPPADKGLQVQRAVAQRVS